MSGHDSPPGLPSVLIVDDDPNHALIAQMVLAAVAPEVAVQVCLDPRLAIAQMEGMKPSAVVFIDRMLNGLESLALVAEAHRRRADLYLVLLSSSLSEEDAARGLSAGAREAMEKPGGIAGWRELVSGVLARSGAVPAVAEARERPDRD